MTESVLESCAANRDPGGVVTDETPPPPPPRPHQRRARYAGKYPRRFDQKYKERHPGRYAETVAKVLASGKTPAGMHRSVMVAEVLAALAPQPGEVAVDCTLGFAGHAQEILARILPGGRLLGLDADPIELPKAEARLRGLGFGADVFTARRGHFAGLSKALGTRTSKAPTSCWRTWASRPCNWMIPAGASLSRMTGRSTCG